MLYLPTFDATHALAQRLAPLVRAGDTFLLEGDVGAGKTAFSRALIQTLQAAAGDPPEDVPSPTFTLVQTYVAGPLEVWHCDLYRLSNPDDVMELGLEAAFADAVCLIEWPDRLGPNRPANATTLRFAHVEDPDARTLTVSGTLAPHLRPALEMTHV